MSKKIFDPFDLLRIATATFLFFDLLGLRGFASLLYGHQSLEPVLPSSPMGLLVRVVSPELVVWFGMGICLLLFVGFVPRLTSFLCWVLVVAFCSSGNLAHYGVHFYFTFALFFVTLSTWFPDLRAGLLAWAKALFAMAYFNAGYAKLISADWRSGERLWTVMIAPEIGGYDANFWAPWATLIVAASWLTILVQLLYPIFAYARRARYATFVILTLVHVQIAIVTGMLVFSGYLIALNAIFLLARGTIDERPHRAFALGLNEKSA